MRTIGNILWLVFGGLVMAIGYAIAGLVMFVLIITIPFGVQSFKLASYTLVRVQLHRRWSPQAAPGDP